MYSTAQSYHHSDADHPILRLSDFLFPAIPIDKGYNSAGRTALDILLPKISTNKSKNRCIHYEYSDFHCIVLTKKMRRTINLQKRGVDKFLSKFVDSVGGRYRTRTCDLPHVKRMLIPAELIVHCFNLECAHSTNHIIAAPPPLVKGFFLPPPT